MQNKEMLVFVRSESKKCDDLLKRIPQTLKNKIKIADITTEEGYKLEKKYEILKLPIVIVLNNKGREINRLYTIEELKEAKNGES